MQLQSGMRLSCVQLVVAGALVAGVAGNLTGQVERAHEGKAEITDALGLTPAQARELEDLRTSKGMVAAEDLGLSNRLISAYRRFGVLDTRPEGIIPSAAALLTQEQKVKLAVIDKVMERYEAAAQAIRLALIAGDEWPGTTLCLYPVVDEEIGLGLSREQIATLEERYIKRLQAEQQRRETSPDKATATGELSDMEAATERDQAVALLNAEQQDKLIAFRMQLKLVREAAELGLVWHQRGGEALCH